MTLRRRLALVLFGILLAAGVGEAALRLWNGEARLFVALVGRTTADLPMHRRSDDPELLYELIPSQDVTVSSELAKLHPEEAAHADDPRRMATNSLGFRDVERAPSKPEGVLRVLCLGGSNTYGAAVSQGRTWPAQLEQVLRERGHDDVEVWNLGTDGYQTRQKIRLAEKALAEWEPDLLLFQLANTGPRLIIDGMQDEVEVWLDPARLPMDGGMYAENLQFFPGTDRWHRPLWLGSSLLRVSMVAVNRIHRSYLLSGTFPDALVERAESRSGAQFGHLVVEARPQTESVLFVPPAGGVPPWVEGLDLPFIDTRGLSDDGLPDIALLHPGARTYRWYAERLADAFLDGGCLAPNPMGTLRCEDLPRTQDRLALGREPAMAPD